MTGRAVPSDDELRARLHKRMYLIGSSPITPGRMPGAPSKRYNAATKMLEAFRSKTLKSKPKTSSAPAFAVGNSSGASQASQGVSPLDIQAAIAGGLTTANPPTAGNSIGLNIEADDTGC